MNNHQKKIKESKKNKMVMFTEERRQEIIDLLRRQNRLTVTELTDLFEVTDVTIRRDFAELENQGLLRRTYGGAIIPESTAVELSLAQREIKYLEEKKKIGKLAAQLVRDGETLMIDGGTTTLQVARNIKRKKNIIVVTDAVNLAMELQGSDEIETMLVGGTLRKKTFVLVGPVAEEALEKFRADKVILGMSALSIKEGLFTANPLEAKVKKIMISCGGELIIVADSSKIGKRAFVFVAPVSDVSKLITDNKIFPADIKTLEDQGVEVLIAE